MAPAAAQQHAGGNVGPSGPPLQANVRRMLTAKQIETLVVEATLFCTILRKWFSGFFRRQMQRGYPDKYTTVWRAMGQSSWPGWMHSWRRATQASCLCISQCLSGTEHTQALQAPAYKKKTNRQIHVYLYSVREEAPDTPHSDLLSVLSRHSNVRQVYSGHYHRGLVWGPLYSFPFTTLPAVRYDSDNFFLLHLARDGSQHQYVATSNTLVSVDHAYMQHIDQLQDC